MHGILNWFRSVFPSEPNRGRRRAVRPQLEQLDDRLVPSVTSGISTTHSWRWMQWTNHDFFAIDAGSHQAVRYEIASPWETNSRTPLYGPQVTDVSASVDPATGNAEVFALGTDGALWRCDSNGTWHGLGGKYQLLSATRDGQVYAETNYPGYLSVRLINGSGGYTDLGSPVANGTSYAVDISAGVGYWGQDQVFAIGPNGGLFVNPSNTPGDWRLIDNSAYFRTLSATRDDQVFAQDWNGQIHLDTDHYAWSYGYFYWTGQDLTPSGSQDKLLGSDMSASGAAEAFVLRETPQSWGGESTVMAYSVGALQSSGFQSWGGAGPWSSFGAPPFAHISGADGGYAFGVDNGNVWALDPNLTTSWSYAYSAWRYNFDGMTSNWIPLWGNVE
jgi:hypothetical protein